MNISFDDFEKEPCSRCGKMYPSPVLMPLKRGDELVICQDCALSLMKNPFVGIKND
jgi:hypothetical protein